MNRLFGKSKPKVPAPTLDDASKSMDSRGSVIDDKIRKLDEELLRYKAQLTKMKQGPAKASLQQRALRCLKQKKVYEKQRDALYGQQLNIDQAKYATESVKDNITLVQAMKDAQKGLKKDMKNLKIDDVEDLHDGQGGDGGGDRAACAQRTRAGQLLTCAVLSSAAADMSDMLEDADEINEIMGRQYGSVHRQRSVQPVLLSLSPLAAHCCCCCCCALLRPRCLLFLLSAQCA
jgi:charged multivesicular body protein 5